VICRGPFGFGGEVGFGEEEKTYCRKVEIMPGDGSVSAGVILLGILVLKFECRMAFSCFFLVGRSRNVVQSFTFELSK